MLVNSNVARQRHPNVKCLDAPLSSLLYRARTPVVSRECRRTAVTTISLVLMAAPSISLNAQLPVLALPALITLPKERKCHHEAGRPLCSWKIREPEIRSALIGG